MKLIILAGGKGTRLGVVDRPKPMVELAGKPLLERQILLAKRYGITEIMLLTGHLSEVIERYFGDGSDLGVRISYHREESPLGTAGAFPLIRDFVKRDRFMVFYGDIVMDFDLSAFIAHDALDTSALATLLVHPNNHPYDSDLMDVDDAGFVAAFHSKPHPSNAFYRNLVNAAVYIFDPAIIDYVTPGKAEDWGKDIFPRILVAGGRLRCYNTPEYIKDMGTKDRFAAIEKDWIDGKIAAYNRANERRAFFLDRDGVLNREVGNLQRLEDLELLPGAAEAVRRINESGSLCIVVTNQPVVAKGWLDEAGLRQIHDKLEWLLGLERAYLDGIYYCPHHPDKGFAGECPELKIDCCCRKPKPGMLLQAAKDFRIRLADSLLIGDSLRDIEAGRAAGLKGCRLIPSNTDHALSEAIQSILDDIV